MACVIFHRPKVSVRTVCWLVIGNSVEPGFWAFFYNHVWKFNRGISISVEMTIEVILITYYIEIGLFNEVKLYG